MISREAEKFYNHLLNKRSEAGNVVSLNTDDGRLEKWSFPDGTVVTMEVPVSEPPITAGHAVYCFSSLVHGLHMALLK